MLRSTRLRVVVVATATFGFRQPFAGGMECQTYDLVTGLRRRGHDVVVYGGPGSDATLGVKEMWNGAVPVSAGARRDVSSAPEQVLGEHYAYQRTMLELARGTDADVVHLSCTHYLPVAMAAMVDTTVTATLHTPPTPWLEMAYRMDPAAGGAMPAAVSPFLARRWKHVFGTRPPVVQNGVDLAAWPTGRGEGGYAVWTGRLVPEKGAHLAIDAARRAGWTIRLAGAAHDPDYFRHEIVPRLGRHARYEGHLDRRDLAALVGAASVAVVTPLWDEPFGLVAVEAWACGTPVAALRRGALPDLVRPPIGALAAPNVGSLASAITEAAGCDRAACRAEAAGRHDLEAMLDGYEAFFHRSMAATAAAGSPAVLPAGPRPVEPLEPVA